MQVLIDPTPEQSVERLTMVADLLDVVLESRFDYTQWVGDDWEGAPDLSCGTTACALGWATTIPALSALGLVLVKEADAGVFVRLSGDRYVYGAAAAEKVFGITLQEAFFLFYPDWTNPIVTYGPRSPGGNATSKEVAIHIREFMKQKWPDLVNKSTAVIHV